MPGWLLASLERPFAVRDPRKLATADALVMLGGTITPSENDVFGFELNHAATRVVTAVELCRLGKANVLVISGLGSAAHPLSEAELLRNWLSAWGMTNTPIHTLPPSAGMRDEALRLQTLATLRGWRRLIIVSSACHLRRAEAVYRRLGLDVTCVGCDYEGLIDNSQDSVFLLPRGNRVRLFNRYCRERILWVVYRCRAWV